MCFLPVYKLKLLVNTIELRLLPWKIIKVEDDYIIVQKSGISSI